MEKEFVPYDLAFRMKELGFDYNILGFYYDNKLLEYCCGNTKVKDLEKGDVAAPTFSQAFSWIREKYDLWCCIKKYPTSENPNRCYYELTGNNINADKDESPNSYMSGWFDSYKEAELACLEKLIKTIEEQK
jgi:hypothetical protein